jgi:predicted O-methyltransferase YrrM
MRLDENTACPVTGDYFGQPMQRVPVDYLKYIHVQPWLPWVYPEVLHYINTRFTPIDNTLLAEIDRNIRDLFYFKWITYPTTAELIALIIRSAGAMNVLELGMLSGFTSLHMVKSVYPHGLCTSIDIVDRRRGHATNLCKTDIFVKLERLGHFRFLKGSLYPHVPGFVTELAGQAPYDFVFIDSSHVVADTLEELKVLWTITQPGAILVFHDCNGMGEHANGMHRFVRSLVRSGHFEGLVLPTCHRMDIWEPTNLGVFRRTNLDISGVKGT